MSTKSRARSRPTPPPPPAKKFPIIPIVGGLIAAALIAAIAISVADSESKAASRVEIGSPELSGEALPPFASSAADPAVGTVIPAVTGTDFDGNVVTIGPGEGPAAIVFLAHWCPHCQREVPAVQAWLDGGGEPAVPLVSVATSISAARDNYPPWSWLDREGWTSPVLVDDEDGTVMLGFGGTGFPYWVFINADGEVVARASGEIGVDNMRQLMELAAA